MYTYDSMTFRRCTLGQCRSPTLLLNLLCFQDSSYFVYQLDCVIASRLSAVIPSFANLCAYQCQKIILHPLDAPLDEIFIPLKVLSAINIAVRLQWTVPRCIKRAFDFNKERNHTSLLIRTRPTNETNPHGNPLVTGYLSHR